MHITRRNVLKSVGYAAALTAVSSELAFAAAPTHKHFVTITLRRGIDGLTAVAPFGGSNYSRLRPQIAVPLPGEQGGAIDLNGYFGLHPSLASLKSFYQTSELAILDAVSSPYRKRSHFDAQNVLKNGFIRPFGIKSGWLNRSLTFLNTSEQATGLAVGHAVPLLMHGKTSVQMWAPSSLPESEEGFIDRLTQVYANDPVFEKALAQAISSAKITSGVMQGTRKGRKSNLKVVAQAAGKLLSRPNGPRIPTIKSNGWDTHAGQKGRPRNKLKGLSDGLLALRENPGEVWQDTVVVVISEFGRTVAVNGGCGTDHSTGVLALILGGSVNGGKIIGRWPGISERAQYQERDLFPANGIRSLCKSVLHDQLGLSETHLEDAIFRIAERRKYWMA